MPTDEKPAILSSDRDPRKWPRKQLVAIFLCAAALAAWHAPTRPVISRDGMQLIRMARYMQTDFLGSLEQIEQNPLYSMLILATHTLLGPLFGGGDVVGGWVASAVTVSLLARMALFVPLMLLARELFDRRTAMWTAWIFVFLPDACNFGTDALTDTTCALLLMFSAYASVRLIRRWRWTDAMVAGLCGGLAYMTRPEGCVAVVVAVGWTIVASVSLLFGGGNRKKIASRLACFATLAACFAAVTLPYMLHMGNAWPKGGKLDSLIELITGAFSSAPSTAGSLAGSLATDGGISQLPAGLAAFGIAYFGSLRWFYGVLILGAIFDGGRRLRSRSGGVFIALVFALSTLGLVALHAIHGYLDRRHVFGVVLLMLPWAGLGLQRLAARVHNAGRRFCPWLAAALKRPRLADKLLASQRTMSVVFLCCGARLGAWRVLPIPNIDKADYRDAARWLRARGSDERPVIDPYGAAAFYAGRRWIDWPSQNLHPAKLHAYFNRRSDQLPKLGLGKGDIVDWTRPLAPESQTDPALRPRYLIWDSDHVRRTIHEQIALDLFRGNHHVRDAVRQRAGLDGERFLARVDAGMKTLPEHIPESVLMALFFHTTWPKTQQVASFGNPADTGHGLRIIELTYPPAPAAASAQVPHH